MSYDPDAEPFVSDLNLPTNQRSNEPFQRIKFFFFDSNQEISILFISWNRKETYKLALPNVSTERIEMNRLRYGRDTNGFESNLLLSLSNFIFAMEIQVESIASDPPTRFVKTCVLITCTTCARISLSLFLSRMDLEERSIRKAETNTLSSLLFSLSFAQRSRRRERRSMLRNEAKRWS